MPDMDMSWFGEEYEEHVLMFFQINNGNQQKNLFIFLII